MYFSAKSKREGKLLLMHADFWISANPTPVPERHIGRRLREILFADLIIPLLNQHIEKDIGD